MFVGTNMKQLNLGLSQTHCGERPEAVIPQARDNLFNFSGRLNIEQRPGQFQYRYGRKIWPKDFILTITAISALAIMPATGHSGLTEQTMNDVTVNRIANAIFRAENSRNHPYGIMIPTRHPRTVCENTIRHAWVDFERDEAGTGGQPMKLSKVKYQPVSLPFISFLGHRYCPPSVDPQGYQHWTNNVYYFLRHENSNQK